MNGLKTHHTHEHPIDNAIINSFENIRPTLYQNKVIPNHLTFISIIFGILSIYFLYNNNRILAAIFYLISYIFDVFDGNYARFYNMETVFGDLLDHISDLFVFISIIYLIFRKNFKHKLIWIILLIINIILLFFHIYNQEKEYDQLHMTPTLNLINTFVDKFNLQHLIPNIEITRYFSAPNITLFVIIMILFAK